MKYYIWSHRKDQWWGPDHGGYSNSLAAAGEYTRTEAADIMFNALPGANVAVEVELGDRRMGTKSPKEVKAELETLRRI